ncbi:MAG: DUF5906 domain-containing protein [Candidatus Heimdallarchaeota archaeon]|nr:DUF5906 domain-containing protein [Candidatus Heimdallarchaeota archaeon]
MNIFFLSGKKQLRKTLSATKNGISKTNYPLIKMFTSTKVEVNTITNFYKVLKQQATTGSCLLKGILKTPLKNETRAGATNSTDETSFLVIDLDNADYSSPEAFLEAHNINTSCVIQYSASAGLNNTLSCHLFFMLASPTTPGVLKNYIWCLNLENEDALQLSKSKTAIKFPIDVTVNQNDKLIYIATPKFIGMKDPLAKNRIYLHKGAQDTLVLPKLPPADKTYKVIKKKLKALRIADGSVPEKLTTKTLFGYQNVATDSSPLKMTGIKTEREFTYFNINGGDSWGYYHHNDSPRVICNFKDEPQLLTELVFPEYFANFSDTDLGEDGIYPSPDDPNITFLAFIDKDDSKYYRGTLNTVTEELELSATNSRQIFDNFCRLHKIPTPPEIPEWRQITDMSEETKIIDKTNRTINLFRLPYYLKPENQKAVEFPQITKLLHNLFGEGEELTRFYNWLAVIVQYKIKTKTAWVINGVFGTGKGTLREILGKLLGRYCVMQRASQLNDQFNEHLEYALICFFDEADTDLFTSSKVVESNLRNYITEPKISIRKMQKAPYEVESRVNIIFNSNSETQPVTIPAGDRRFNTTAFRTTKIIWTDAEYDACTSHEELCGFAYFLQNYKADKVLARTTLENENKAAIQGRSTTSVDELATAILKGNLSILIDALPDVRTLNTPSATVGLAGVYVDLMKEIAKHIKQDQKNPWKMTRDDLFIIFRYCIGTVPQGANKFTSYLRHHGIATKRIRFDTGLQYGIAVNWKVSEDDKELLEKL